MEKFRYLTSEDHAKWYVTNPHGGIEMLSSVFDEDPGMRVRMRQWIEDNCIGRVYAWNKTMTPAVGATNWGEIVMPQGGVVMHFEDERDRVLFKLTWT